MSCTLTTSHGHPTLGVSARVAEAAAPAADFSLELLEASPTSGALTYDASSSRELAVGVAFTPEGGKLPYRYTAEADSAAGAVSSSCSVVVTALSDDWATGQLACRNLLASATSADATLPDGSRGRASATIAFDCPIRAHSARPVPGGSGGAPGTAGSTSGGTSGSGTSSGGTSGVSGSAGSLPKSCHGTVSACSLQGSLGCESTQGCSRSGSCEGLSRSCYAYFEASGCYGQQGCYWSSLSKNCQGSSWGCDLFDGSATCASQYGCDWEETCSGVATPCSLLGELTCSSQPGCSWY